MCKLAKKDNIMRFFFQNWQCYKRLYTETLPIFTVKLSDFCPITYIILSRVNLGPRYYVFMYNIVCMTVYT